MSGLPQELIDHIIDHVHDRKSLKACSLVCGQWSLRSRKHLFAQLEFTSIRDLLRWCTRIRPEPSGPSSLVEYLTLSEYRSSLTVPAPTRFCPSELFIYAAPHFQSFSALRALEIRRWHMTVDCVSSMLHSFGSSLENVTRLILKDIYVHPSTLAMFVSHFPCLDISASKLSGTLDATDSSLSGVRADDTVPTHPRGGFYASDILKYQVPKGVFEAITLLRPRFRRIVLTYVSYNAWRDYWPLIEACAESLEELHIFADTTDADCNGLSLECCPNLRRIVLSFGRETPARPCEFVEKCLSTITSTRLSLVCLCLLGDIVHPKLLCSNLASWDPLDIALNNLTERYQPREIGDAMLLKLVDVDPDPPDNFLRRYSRREDSDIEVEYSRRYR